MVAGVDCPSRAELLDQRGPLGKGPSASGRVLRSVMW